MRILKNCSLTLSFFFITTIIILNPLTAFGKKADSLKIGGALRFNYRYMDWTDEDYARINKAQLGEFLLDTYRINVDATNSGIDLSLEYRIYAGYQMLHHGYLGYAFNDNLSMQLGVNQVPFGIQKYASHNWFFSIAYYLGLEDDYDAGLKFIYDNGDGLNLKFACYRSGEGNYTGASDNSSRYSYDVVDESYLGMKSNNREAGQFNARATYTFTGEKWNVELGLSGQYGLLFNEALDRIGRLDNPDSVYTGNTDAWGHYSAFAAHMNANYRAFNLMAYGMLVDHHPKTVNSSSLVTLYDGNMNPYTFVTSDFSNDLVVYGAYDFPYPVASKGVVVAFEPAYTVPVSWGPISSLQFYNDFSAYLKSKKDFEDSYHNVTGVLISAGKVYTYVDVAQGKNDPWLGQFNGLGSGVPNAEWKMRFNVNIGYYF